MKNKVLVVAFFLLAVIINGNSQNAVTIPLNRKVAPIYSYNNELNIAMDSIAITMPFFAATYLAGDYSYDKTKFTIVTATTHRNNEAFVTLYLIPYKSDSVYVCQGINETSINNDSPAIISVNNKEYSITIYSGAATATIKEVTGYNKFDAELKDQNKLPDVSFPLVYGEERSFESYEHTSQYIYIEFWGTWCSGCFKAMEPLKNIYDKYKEQLCIISLAYSNGKIDTNDVKNVIENHHLIWTQGIANNYITRLFYENGSAPYGILFDSDGNLIKREMNVEELQSFLQVKFGN